jgi:phasin family protein
VEFGARKIVPTGNERGRRPVGKESNHKNSGGHVMANPRQAERDISQATQEVTREARETARKAAEETSRAARAAADASAGATRAGADLFQRNAETMQEAWRSGSKVASQLTEQSVQGFARAFGMTGERAEQAAAQSSRNMECFVQSGTVIAGAMQNISREMFEFARKRVEQNLQRVDALANCRTPQEILAAQSDLMRDNLEDMVQSTRRISEISMEMADEAARRMGDISLAPRQ